MSEKYTLKEVKTSDDEKKWLSFPAKLYKKGSTTIFVGKGKDHHERTRWHF